MDAGIGVGVDSTFSSCQTPQAAKSSAASVVAAAFHHPSSQRRAPNMRPVRTGREFERQANAQSFERITSARMASTMSDLKIAYRPMTFADIDAATYVRQEALSFLTRSE